jgi:glycerol-3-phosphate dehydrogenase
MRLAFLNKEATLAVAPKVADLMAQSLGWGWAEKKRQLKEAQEYISQFGGAIPASGALAVG